MKELTLPEIKQIELEILRYFKEICREKDLHYFLSNGTILGAVKYQGFIPWDDDIDVFMPREDYDRLIADFKDSEKFVLFSNQRNPDFAFPFAKLCDMRTRKEESGANNGVTLGLDIDIFPLDAWNGSLEQAQAAIDKIYGYIQKISLAKLPYSRGRNPIRTVLKYAALSGAKLVGANGYVKKIQKLVAKKSVATDPKYMGCFVWPIYGRREIVPAQVFSSTVQVTFEGEEFSAPAGYDVYLRSLYGDYEQELPPEKQKTHHSFRAYRI